MKQVAKAGLAVLAEAGGGCQAFEGRSCLVGSFSLSFCCSIDSFVNTIGRDRTQPSSVLVCLEVMAGAGGRGRRQGAGAGGQGAGARGQIM